MIAPDVFAHLLLYETVQIHGLCFANVATREPLGPLEAFLFIPQKLIISEDMIKASEIGYIVKAHPELFEDHYDQEYLVLIVFIMFEMCKGEASFWYPYFITVSESDLPYEWNDKEIEELHDELLRVESGEYKREV